MFIVIKKWETLTSVSTSITNKTDQIRGSVNLKNLLLLTSLASVLAATTVYSQTLIYLNDKNLNYSTQEQVQSSTISISAATLAQPHILTVSVSKGDMEGFIELNGKVLHYITDKDTRVDLSSHLLRGRNKLKIWGNYNFKNALVTVELSAPQTQVTQQTSNNGKLNQIIILEVR